LALSRVSTSTAATAGIPASTVPRVCPWRWIIRSRGVAGLDDIPDLQYFLLIVDFGDFRGADNLCFAGLRLIRGFPLIGRRLVLIAFRLGDAWHCDE
jgi:hypothetical protein